MQSKVVGFIKTHLFLQLFNSQIRINYHKLDWKIKQIIPSRPLRWSGVTQRSTYSFLVLSTKSHSVNSWCSKRVCGVVWDHLQHQTISWYQYRLKHSSVHFSSNSFFQTHRFNPIIHFAHIMVMTAKPSPPVEEYDPLCHHSDQVPV